MSRTAAHIIVALVAVAAVAYVLATSFGGILTDLLAAR